MHFLFSDQHNFEIHLTLPLFFLAIKQTEAKHYNLSLDPEILFPLNNFTFQYFSNTI